MNNNNSVKFDRDNHSTGIIKPEQMKGGSKMVSPRQFVKPTNNYMVNIPQKT